MCLNQWIRLLTKEFRPQSRIRKNFAASLLLLMIVSSTHFISCSHLNQKNSVENRLSPEQELTDLKRSLKAFCLSGEGKGRLVIENKKYQFSYESVYDFQNGSWSIALNFPFYGEEVFHLPWRSLLNNPQAKLHFLQQIKIEEKNKKDISAFLMAMANFFEFYSGYFQDNNAPDDRAKSETAFNCSGPGEANGTGQCVSRMNLTPRTEKEIISWKNQHAKLSLDIKAAEKKYLVIEGMDLRKSYFQRINLALIDQSGVKWRYAKNPSIELSLHVLHCVTP